MAPCSVCQYPPPLGGADSTNTTERSTPQHHSCMMESTAVFASTRPPEEGRIVQTPLGFHGATTKEIYIPQSDSVRKNLLRFSRKHVWWKPPKKWKLDSVGFRISMLASGKDASWDEAHEHTSISSDGVREIEVMSDGAPSAAPVGYLGGKRKYPHAVGRAACIGLPAPVRLHTMRRLFDLGFPIFGFPVAPRTQ